MNLEVCSTKILSDIPGAVVIPVGHCEVIYVPTWLPDSDEWFELLKTLPWTAEEIMMYGRELSLKRQTVNYGDHYNYNPKAKPALPWTTSRPVTELKSRLEQATGGIYTQCACNRYSDGSVIIGVHRDKRDPILIASISFGAERQMGFCAKDEDKIDRSLPIVTLASGSLLLFDGDFNRSYKHGIVPNKSVSGERISVTFRQFKDEPELKHR